MSNKLLLAQSVAEPGQERATTQATAGLVLQSGLLPSADIDADRRRNGRPDSVPRDGQEQHDVAIGCETSRALDAESRKVVEELRTQKDFQRLTSVEQAKLLDVLSFCLAWTDGGKESVNQAFSALLARSVNTGAVLQQTDRNGKSVIDNLHALTVHPRELLGAGLGERRDELILSLVRELAWPDKEIDQGSATSCVTTVGNAKLARDYPAEYARFITDLATAGRARLIEQDFNTGQVRLSESLWFEYDPRFISESFRQGRSITEGIFQGAAGDFVGAFPEGLYSNQAETYYEAVFGVPFLRIDALDEDGKLQCLSELRRVTQAYGGVNMVCLKWEAGGVHGHHAIEVLDVRDGAVYFRNPWGSHSGAVSQLESEAVAAESGIYRMSVAEFKQRLDYVMVTDKNQRAALGVTPGGHWDSGARVQFIDDGNFSLFYQMTKSHVLERKKKIGVPERED